jgi:S1-C subfamily serine protease
MNKHRPWLYILGAVVLIGALGLSALGGAAITYLITRPTPVRAAIGFVQEQGGADAGLLIARVADDSPAAAAGLVRGDILLRVDDTEVNTFADLRGALAKREPGDTIVVTALHGDETRALEVTLGGADDRPYLGIMPCTCDVRNDDLRVPGPAWRFRDPESAVPFRELLGAEIIEIVPEGPAAEAGLAVGDVIVSVDGEDVGPGANLAEMIQAHAPGDTVELEIIAADADTAEDNAAHDVTVTLGAHPDDADAAYLGVRVRGFVRIERPERPGGPFNFDFNDLGRNDA